MCSKSFDSKAALSMHLMRVHRKRKLTVISDISDSKQAKSTEVPIEQSLSETDAVQKAADVVGGKKLCKNCGNFYVNLANHKKCSKRLLQVFSLLKVLLNSNSVQLCSQNSGIHLSGNDPTASDTVSVEQNNAGYSNVGTQSTESDIPLVKPRRTTVVHRGKRRNSKQTDQPASIETADVTKPTQAPQTTTGTANHYIRLLSTEKGCNARTSHSHAALCWAGSVEEKLLEEEYTQEKGGRSWQFTTTVFHCKLTTYSQRCLV